MDRNFQSGDDRPAETHYERDGASEPEPSPDSLLDEVLENTVPSQDEPLAPEELAALQEVARQHPDAPLALEPMGVALIESLLKLRLPDRAKSMTGEMAQSIATAMFDSPETEARLRNLWDQLRESVR